MSDAPAGIRRDGTVLGFDVGARRIGVAVGSPFGHGARAVAVVDVGPFAEAFVLLIVVPLAAAAVTQALAPSSRVARGLESAMLSAMVPLMVATLLVVVASQAGTVRAQASQLLVLVPLYTAFLVVMALLGMGAGKLSGLDVPSRRALVFSGATRN